jgi:pyruvate/2-oxoglutarate dehydrogenase complex dihydrolipoamide dehydrogenase (E3) component
MTKVVVIGGGTAGFEAAAEASRNEAEVILAERSDRWEPSWYVWPAMILSPERSEGPPSLPNGVELTYGADVASVGRDSLFTADRTWVNFDSVVLATGGEFGPTAFPGRRKSGVVILDGSGAFAELGREKSSMTRVVVQGEGVQALQVADGLSGKGRKVTLLAAPSMEEFASATIGSAINDAAAERDVFILNSKLGSAVGSGHLEAVVAGGTVLPCDTLAVLPRRIPRVPRTLAERGPNGGLLVDQNLRSSSPVLFAAGACAEPRYGWPNPRTLVGAAAKSGRVAGANSMGHRLTLRPPKFAEASFYGLRWAKAGVRLGEARAHGLDVSEISRRWSSESACSIVYERPTGRIVGVELVIEEGDERLGILAAITPSTSLRGVAYGTSGDSSDISLLSDTARLGLQVWSGS